LIYTIIQPSTLSFSHQHYHSANFKAGILNWGKIYPWW